MVLFVPYRAQSSRQRHTGRSRPATSWPSCRPPVLPAQSSSHLQGKRGQVSVDVLRGILYNRVKLNAITHNPTNGGLVN